MARRWKSVGVVGCVMWAGVAGVLMHAAPPLTRYVVTDAVVIDLGTLGGTESIANDVNDWGEIVGTSQAANGAWHAFLKGSTAMIDLGPGIARGINNRSDAVGSDGSLPIVWHTASAWIPRDILPLLPCCTQEGTAVAINASGVILGEQLDGIGLRWTSPTAMPTEPYFTYAGEYLYDINAAGSFVDYTQHFDNEAFRWQNGTAAEMPWPASSSWPYGAPYRGRAYGISDGGWVVGSWLFWDGSVYHERALLWDGASSWSVLLGTLPGGTDSKAAEVNGQGFVAGTANVVRTGHIRLSMNRAFLWHADFGMRELPLPSWSANCEASSLNDRRADGLITVAGTCGIAGARHAVRWSVIVERRAVRTLGPTP